MLNVRSGKGGRREQHLRGEEQRDVRLENWCRVLLGKGTWGSGWEVTKRNPWSEGARRPQQRAQAWGVLGSWTPMCSEVADRQLEADLKIEVTGTRSGNKSWSKKKEKVAAVGRDPGPCS